MCCAVWVKQRLLCGGLNLRKVSTSFAVGGGAKMGLQIDNLLRLKRSWSGLEVQSLCVFFSRRLINGCTAIVVCYNLGQY